MQPICTKLLREARAKSGRGEVVLRRPFREVQHEETPALPAAPPETKRQISTERVDFREPIVARAEPQVVARARSRSILWGLGGRGVRGWRARGRASGGRRLGSPRDGGTGASRHYVA